MREYSAENLYSYVMVRRPPEGLLELEAETPISQVEETIDRALAEAAAHLQHEEYVLALRAYQSLSALILRELTPSAPPHAFEGMADGVRPVLATVLPRLFETAVRFLATPGTEASPFSEPVPLRRQATRSSPRPTRIELPLGTTTHTIDLASNPAASLLQYYERRAQAPGIAATSVQPIHTVASVHLPHMYAFVIPMAIGDCHMGLGAFAAAESSYRGALEYPYLDSEIETVRVWMRLAELTVEAADHAYRRAGNIAARFGDAGAIYARVIGAAGAVDPAGPLYADPRFAAIRARVEAIAQGDPVAIDENPAMTAIVLRARAAQTQIAAGLNFFGFAPNYIPPFTFEHLQGSARYFAQQAARLGATYLNFKSQAEREELGRDQLDQQVELARATVDLEKLHAAEVRAGLRVATEGQDYAELQREHAEEVRDAFDDVRWELLELAHLEAWSSAAAVNEEDEIKQTVHGNTYYRAEKRRRSEVLADLARRRTRISHDLEAARLEREVESAAAYAQIAQAQVAQAEARVAIAEMREQIAALQQRHAEHNRDFVEAKELNAGAWYELARTVRLLARRYLDMATEAAFLMERAYALETGRDLARIRFDLASSAATGALAGDALLADIDSFTQDYFANVRTKRAPSKLVVSVADAFPIAFDRLRRTGRCTFETTFGLFERGLPGAWLAKLRNVELVFVGITSAAGLQGTLRNTGMSRIRRPDGAETTIVAPADVLPLTQYEPRNDALLFRFNANELRVFENCGVASHWRLELPLDANDVDLGQLLDIQLVLYFDSFYDTALETSVRAALPAGGRASRAMSLALQWPDELFYLRNQGEAAIAVTPGSIPHNHVAPVRHSVTLRALGSPETVRGLVLRLASKGLDGKVPVVLDASGTSLPGALDALVGRTLLDDWTISISAEDNPGRLAGTTPVLEGLTDLQIFTEYDFTYRTGA